MASLREDLAADAVAFEETHISLVFLHDDEVFKVKKPVDLGFLDFTTPEKRRAACLAEVELNRRLTRDVYLGVVPVTRDADGRHRLDGEGDPVDWAVRMRRLPDAARGDHLLAAGRLGPSQIDGVAARLATFHADARCDEHTSSFGSTEAIARNVSENFRQTRASIAGYLSLQEAMEIEEWQTSFLQEHADLFEARRIAGRVRDGHGDLRLEHLYLEAPDSSEGEAVRIIDCIEFNERFRFADVCADIAFLAMDLSWHGHVELAEHFLARYARHAQDYDFYALVDFYQSYRAYVRGKVAAMLAADEEAAGDVRRRAADEAHRYFKLALAAQRPSLLAPAVVAVGGPIASGKSTVAEWVGSHLSAPVVDTDRTRKAMLGVAPTAKVHVAPFSGPYSETTSERVYEEVLRRAEVVLASGRPVVVDASFRSAADRGRVADLAVRHGVELHFVECRAEPELLRRRLEQRAATTGVSDGRLEILDDFLARWEEVTELAPEQHVVLDTSVPFATTEDRLRRHIALWPSRLTG